MRLRKNHSVQIKLVGTQTCLSLPEGAQYSKNHKEFNESSGINVNEELSKFKDSINEELIPINYHFWQKIIPLKRGT